uniref:Protein phosphatase 6, regulatory subunit 3 n=1 Tax=Astyanax mexicanus TaxID=7994 RepID=A0A8B9JEV1_ASTMX
MFWKFDLHTTSHIDTLLDKEDVTLTEVMDEEDVLQECKAQNHKLVDFLVRPQCMEDLVGYITQEPNDDVEEKIKYKYPNISCELLTSDVGQINDRLGEDESLLMKLYSFLQNEPPLNPLLASFFSKVLSILIGRKPEQIVEFLRKREDFVDLMIKHIGTSAIMDLLLRMLTCIEPQQLRQDVLNWLNEEKVIQRLVDMVQPSQDEDRHSNASQSLCEIIRLSRDQMFQVQGCSEPDPLLATLEKQETVEQLLSNIFDKEKNESAIVSVIQILLTLFETRRPAFEGHLELCPPGLNHPSFSVNQSILDAVRPRLKDFHQLLLEPPKKTVLKTTWGVLDPPVGNTRLNVVRLVASLLQTNTHIINQELINLNMLGVILDMYFKYIWNNFLHIQVEICTAMILAMPPTQSDSEINREDDQEPVRENILITHLFQKCRMIQRILDNLTLSLGPVWTANFDDIPMDTGSASNAPLSSPSDPAAWSSPSASGATETGWADFSSFTPVSPKDPLRSNSPVAMETSIETVDPLGVNAPARKSSVGQWPNDEDTQSPTSPKGTTGSSDAEEEPASDRITETVTNGSMKETLSLTVDAKTETAVFKRVLKSYREEEKQSTSEDASGKYAVGESGEAERNASAPPASNCQKSGAKHLEEKTKATCESLNGPLENTAALEEAK